jgi:hypothetical protein
VTRYVTQELRSLMGHGGDRAWVTEATCRDLPTEAFFPEDDNDPVTPAARAACAICPVVAECAAYGAHEKTGTWGGRSSKERRVADRQSRYAARRVAS